MIDVADWVNRVWEGDCMDFMRRLPDDSVAWTLADPLYNAGIDYGATSDDKQSWDVWAAWLDERIREMERVSRGMVLVFASITGMLEFTRLCRRPAWVAVWNKPLSLSHRVGGSPWLPHWEALMQFGRAWGPGGRVPDYSLGDVLSVSPDYKTKGHPCPKPVALLKKIIAAIPGDPILDPFAGLGSTLVAAEELGRQAILCEINPEYVKMAEKRIAREREKLQLPFE